MSLPFGEFIILHEGVTDYKPLSNGGHLNMSDYSRRLN